MSLNFADKEEGTVVIHNRDEYISKVKEAFIREGLSEEETVKFVSVEANLPYIDGPYPSKIRLTSESMTITVGESSVLHKTYRLEYNCWDKMDDIYVKELMAKEEIVKELKIIDDHSFSAKSYDALVLGCIMLTKITTEAELERLKSFLFEGYVNKDFPVVATKNLYGIHDLVVVQTKDIVI